MHIYLYANIHILSLSLSLSLSILKKKTENYYNLYSFVTCTMGKEKTTFPRDLVSSKNYFLI